MFFFFYIQFFFVQLLVISKPIRKNGEGLKITALSGNRCKSINKEYLYTICVMINSIISVIVFWIIYLVIILLRYFLLTVMNNDKWLLSNEEEKITWFSFFMRGLYFEILPFCIKSRQYNYNSQVPFFLCNSIFFISNTFRINPQRMLLRILRWI